nr:TIGR03663 family protein [Halobacterium salinarum]
MDSTGRDRRVVVAGAVAAVVAGALAARLAGLGARPFHADEARVGYWILDYHATGAWSYRPIVHGPFLFHVNDALFGLFGASDAVARAPVAVVGGLLPGVAWLFRGRLDDTEVIALAGLLAFTPTLVYYSRFMRSDVLVAAFSLAAVGFAVRAHDTGRRWLLPVTAGWLALALTAKENALVYAAMFAGGGRARRGSPAAHRQSPGAVLDAVAAGRCHTGRPRILGVAAHARGVRGGCGCRVRRVLHSSAGRGRTRRYSHPASVRRRRRVRRRRPCPLADVGRRRGRPRPQLHRVPGGRRAHAGHDRRRGRGGVACSGSSRSGTPPTLPGRSCCSRATGGSPRSSCTPRSRPWRARGR